MDCNSMRRHKQIIFSFIAFVVFIFLVSLSSANIIPFYDDFENVPDGEYPSANGWENWGENFNGYSAYVTDEISYSGEKSFKLVGWNTEARVECLHFSSIPDKITYEVCVYVPDIKKGGAVAGFGLERGALVIVFNAVQFDGYGKIVFLKDYQDDYFVKLQDYTPNQWYEIKVEMDYINLKANVYIDGELKGKNLDILPKKFTHERWGDLELENFIIMTNNFQSLFYRRSVIYFDDVKLYSNLDKPDLIIKDVTFFPKNPSDGDKVNVSVKIGNAGGKSVSNFDIKCYVDGYYYDSRFVNVMDKGEEKIMNFTWNAIYGKHDFSFVVDENNIIDEITEGNNVKNISIEVGPLLTISVPQIISLKEEEEKKLNITLHCYGCPIQNVTLFSSSHNISLRIPERKFAIIEPGKPEEVSILIKASKLGNREKINGKIMLWAVGENAESEKKEINVVVYAVFHAEEIVFSIFSITGLIALLYIVFTESGKYRFFSFLAFIIPLYAKVGKDEILDNFVRGQIYGFIKSNPGCHYCYIKKKLDIKNGVLAYHLKILEKSGLIKSEKRGRHRIFTVTGISFPESKRYTLSELQISILDLIKNNGGITQKEIASHLNQKQQKISYNLKILEMANKIVSIKKGRKKHYYIYEDFYEDE